MRARLSYANVMSTIAVFLAIAGGSVAIGAALSRNSVKSKQVKNESLTRKDLRNAKAVGTKEVIDGTIGTADLAAEEAAHVVGTAGEPGFGNGGQGDCEWFDLSATSAVFAPVSFYRDRDGRVQLGGTAASNDGSGGDGACDNTPAGEALEDTQMFTLPAGYRPADVVLHNVSDGAANYNLLIGASEDRPFGPLTLPAGAVAILGPPGPFTSGLSLEGVSFRAAG